MDFAKIKEAAQNYSADMNQFLRDIVRNPRAMSAMGYTFPVSLFTNMTETSAVSGRTASSTCSAVIFPFPSGARYVTS